MKYCFDTEFQEEVDKRGRGILWLISLGIVCEDGRSSYWECKGFDWTKAQAWQIENVKPYLTGQTTPRHLIAQQLVDFVGDDPEPEFWAYVDCYDWVALMQLFGGLMNRPKQWPHSSKDIKELMISAGLIWEDLPPQKGTLHRADHDALWNMKALKFIFRRINKKKDPVAELLKEWQRELEKRLGYWRDPDEGTLLLMELVPQLAKALRKK